MGGGAIYRDRETGRKVSVEVRSRMFRDVLVLRCAIGNQVASCIFMFALLGKAWVGGEF